MALFARAAADAGDSKEEEEPTLSKQPSGSTAVALAVLRRSQLPQAATGAHALIRRPSGKAKVTNANAKAEAREQLARGRKRNVPVLGKSGSTVFNAVAGAFQECVDRGAAARVDEDVIAAALKVKSVKFDSEGPIVGP